MRSNLAPVENGEVYASGGNGFGQLGLGNKSPADTPQKLAAFAPGQVRKLACKHHSAALTHAGELFLWGTGAFGEYLNPHQVTFIPEKLTDIELGGCFGLAVDLKGSVWAWGSNTSGELGLGDFEARAYPYPILSLEEKPIAHLACGTAHVIAVISPPVESSRQRPAQLAKTATLESPGRTAKRVPGKIETSKTAATRKEPQLKSMLFPASQRRQEEIERKPQDMLAATTLLSNSERTGSRLFGAVKKERDFFEDAMKNERTERQRAEAEIADLNSKVRDTASELEQTRADLQRKAEECERLKANAEEQQRKSEAQLQEHERRLDNARLDIERTRSENARLSKLLEEMEESARKSSVDLELAHKDVETARRKAQAEHDECWKDLEERKKECSDLGSLVTELKRREEQHAEDMGECKRQREEERAEDEERLGKIRRDNAELVGKLELLQSQY